tara:strand:- start:2091 stop:2345 length:255 start_codon:yes stop_codon:yes gene_type:complete
MELFDRMTSVAIAFRCVATGENVEALSLGDPSNSYPVDPLLKIFCRTNLSVVTRGVSDVGTSEQADSGIFGSMPRAGITQNFGR